MYCDDIKVVRSEEDGANSSSLLHEPHKDLFEPLT